ncbi:MAG: hypothetical protein H6936_12620 [Burkholderiales bacterium]|nr:hypothetical protein [Nitrosomonas sp.]MCP5275665.1 hypothetical protein [Burkholderiales bacterium]
MMKILLKFFFILLVLLDIGTVKSENTDQGGYPSYNYKDGTLILPRVDVSGQVGRYQDVEFQFDPQLNAWILNKHHSRAVMPQTNRVLGVLPQVIALNRSVPSTVLLHIEGEHTCSRIGQINQRRVGDLFEIQITEDPLHPTEICDQKTRIFRRVIQLDVFRLKAGEYQYSINHGEATGSFTLPFDTSSNFNECGGSPEDDDTPNACAIIF